MPGPAEPVRAHAALLLAAGGSRRLGRPKQLLARDGERLVRRTLRLLAQTAPARLLIVVGANDAAVRSAVAGIDCEIVANPGWERGLGGSLRAAGDALGAWRGPVLVAACDQPALEASHLEALLAGACGAPERCAATRHGAGRGVPAVVPGTWFATTVSQGDHGFGARLRALPDGACWLLEAPELALDVDTPAALDAAIARGWVDRPAG